jgi:hypothetical protein
LKTNIFFIALTIISFSVFADNSDCNAFACKHTSSNNGHPSVFLENKGKTELICFLHVDQRKKTFIIEAGGRSNEYTSRHKARYQYFSWNCGETDHCPIWAKSYCK